LPLDFNLVDSIQLVLLTCIHNGKREMGVSIFQIVSLRSFHFDALMDLVGVSTDVLMFLRVWVGHSALANEFS
jgi:hypothetical protein